MKLFKNLQNQIYGYDENDPSQLDLIDEAIANKWEDITNTYQYAQINNQKKSIYEMSAQNLLDKQAQSWGYDSMISACSYINSTNPQFKQDAESLISWRDIVWAKIIDIENQGLPSTVEDFLNLLPSAPNKTTI